MKRMICFIFLLLASLTVRADIERGDTKESLRGLKGVCVTTEFINMQPEGLTAEGIAALAKSVLTNAAITVDPSPKKSNGSASLSITVAALKQPQLNLYLFTIEIALTQDVQLTRQPKAGSVSAQTWRRSTQGLTPPNRTDVIEQTIKQGVEGFVKEYRAVN